MFPQCVAHQSGTISPSSASSLVSGLQKLLIKNNLNGFHVTFLLHIILHIIINNRSGDSSCEVPKLAMEGRVVLWSNEDRRSLRDMESANQSGEFRCIVSAGDWCGESPVWNATQQALFWVDINRRLVHRFKPDNDELRRWEFEEPVAGVALTKEEKVLLVALGSRVVFWEPETHSWSDAGLRLEGWPRVRFNDGRVDPRGSFWVGTMWNNVLPDGGEGETGGTDGVLYRFDPGGEANVWERGIGIANTVAWSPDGTKFYFGDTLANEVRVYDYDLDTGTIANRRPFLSGFECGLPDGSAVDAEGYLWNCRVGGGCIVRVAPDGMIDRVLEFPTPKPTSCTFGGKDLDTLFVTSISLGVSGDALAGGLFALDAGVRGVAEHRFAGTPSL